MPFDRGLDLSLSLQEHLVQYLHFSYIPDFAMANDFAKFLRELDIVPIIERDEDTLIELGIEAWNNSFESIPQGTHVVPITSGLDSRAILGTLLQYFPAQDIQTVTFGLPHTWDYEIGKKIAKKVGTRHISINLLHIQPTLRQIEEHAQNLPPLPILDHYYYSQIFREFSTDVIYWSGHMGGAISGVHTLDNETELSWNEATNLFIAQNRYPEFSINKEETNLYEFFPSNPYLNKNSISYYDQLNLMIRQHCYLGQFLMPDGYTFAAPFIHPSWLRFMLAVPPEARKDRHLYKRLLIKMFPSLFSLPTNRNIGLSLRSPRWRRKLQKIIRRSIIENLPNFLSIRYPNPRLKYVDYYSLLRQNTSLRNLVWTSLERLKKRNIVRWIDIEDILSRHQIGVESHSRTLLTLMGVDIFLECFSP
ncbi:MAG: hypothetical protein H6673_09000 [Anaerolineales bacterium]|nr:hypothetical protein [Anaerolineales bacterium]